MSDRRQVVLSPWRADRRPRSAATGVPCGRSQSMVLLDSSAGRVPPVWWAVASRSTDEKLERSASRELTGLAPPTQCLPGAQARCEQHRRCRAIDLRAAAATKPWTGDRDEPPGPVPVRALRLCGDLGAATIALPPGVRRDRDSPGQLSRRGEPPVCAAVSRRGVSRVPIGSCASAC